MESSCSKPASRELGCDGADAARRVSVRPRGRDPTLYRLRSVKIALTRESLGLSDAQAQRTAHLATELILFLPSAVIGLKTPGELRQLTLAQAMDASKVASFGGRDHRSGLF
jgi:hypothetical protein